MPESWYFAAAPHPPHSDSSRLPDLTAFFQPLPHQQTAARYTRYSPTCTSSPGAPRCLRDGFGTRKILHETVRHSSTHLPEHARAGCLPRRLCVTRSPVASFGLAWLGIQHLSTIMPYCPSTSPLHTTTSLVGPQHNLILTIIGAPTCS